MSRAERFFVNRRHALGSLGVAFDHLAIRKLSRARARANEVVAMYR